MKDANKITVCHQSAGLLRTVLRAWDRFWFTPADPTLFCLIRICCGVITLYTIAAYSFSLQEFFGPNGWVNLDLRLRSRYEAPVVASPLTWDEARPAARPETPEQQRYFDEYFQKWHVSPPGPFPISEKEEADIDAYCKYWGIDPRVAYSRGTPIWSIWFHVTDPFWMAVVHGFIVLSVFLFTIGFATRITSVLTWAGVLCYIQRSPPSLFGADTMMNILLLYLMIGPSGAALSVDRLLARWWARKQGAGGRGQELGVRNQESGVRSQESGVRNQESGIRNQESGKSVSFSSLPPDLRPLAPAPSVTANFALRLLQIHVCIIYLAAGLAKLQGAAWWNGTAVWGTLANFEFAPMQYDLYTNSLRALARNRPLVELFITGAGVFTLAFEISYVFLIWRPATRWVMLSMAILLHGFIGLFMGLKTFSLMMLVMNMAFLPPETVWGFLRSLTGARKPGDKEIRRQGDKETAATLVAERSV
jgi:Vitamin K-dependent gamma-carboxylase